MAELLETSISHLKGNDYIEFTAAEPWSISLIKKLKLKYPDDIEIRYENEDGSLYAHVPRRWLKISPPRRVNLSDERKKAIAEQLAKGRAAIKSSKDDGEGEESEILLE